MENLGFPDPRQAEDHGLLAIGGSFRPEVLLRAYAHGIFPWPSHDLPCAWYSPNPRTVLVPGQLHLSRSLRKTLRRGRFRVTFDTAFQEVVRLCAAAPRPHQDGTWITDELMAGFVELHRLGLAHSAEAWREDQLVGGLYGLSLGAVFFGESMFHHATDASKVAFVTLARQLEAWSFELIDCQIQTELVASLGAREWERDDFLDTLAGALREPTRRGRWRPDVPPLCAPSTPRG